MTQARKIGTGVKTVSKHSKNFFESFTGYLFMILMFPVWLLGFIIKWFAHNIDMIAMALLAAFSYGWSVENYFLLLGYGDLLQSLGTCFWGVINWNLDFGLFLGVLTAVFIATLIQSIEYAGAREREKKKRLADVDGHEPDNLTIWAGWLFYFVEFLVALATVGYRVSSSGAQYLPLALLIGAISIWGFEYGVNWIERHGSK